MIWKINLGDIIESNAQSLRDTCATMFVYNANYRTLLNDHEKLRDYVAVEMAAI